MADYSHSRLETFETCPLKFKFRYIERVETPIEETVEMFVGSRVHETLEKLYQDLHYEKCDTLDELLAFFHAEWQKNWNPGVKITRQNLTEQNFFDYGVRYIRNYYERYKPFNDTRTLATELKLTFSLDGEDQFRITGFVDRVARRSDGTYEIHDYKTSRQVPAQADLDGDRQLALYEIGLKQRWPDAERVDLVWHYVGHATTLRSSRTAEQLAELRESTIVRIREIEAEEEFAPNKGSHCEWCEYRPICPVWKHVIHAQALPPAEFAADEGVKLANELAETKRQMRALEQREGTLRELIIEFCRQTRVKVVQGSAAQVSVKIGERTLLPRKQDARRAELEAFVRKTGKWDEVSDLSPSALLQVMKEKTWPANLLKELDKFAWKEESVTVSVRFEKEPEE
jgi:putative RecB family exonuclease